MSVKLQDYAEVVGQQVIDELHLIAQRVDHLHLQNINATAVGGGVAEVLTRMVPLLRELGIQTSWDIIKGNDAFFNVSRAFHSALHGAPTEITDEMFETYRETTNMNLRETEVSGDIVMIHDPHPMGLIEQEGPKDRKWIWRCHIDVSKPDRSVWGFLSDFAEKYDAAIFSMPDFAHELPVPQYVVPPSIDPLSDRNKELSAQGAKLPRPNPDFKPKQKK